MNYTWNLSVLYNGFDDPEFSSDIKKLGEKIGEVVAFAKNAEELSHAEMLEKYIVESWDVVIVTDDGQLEELTDASGGQHQIFDSGCAFVVCANYVRSMSRYGDRGILYALQDATIAATYMMLAAHAIRLHTCWVGQFDDEAVKEILDLPTHLRPAVILTVGIGMPPHASPERMDAEEHAHYDIW